MHDLETIIARNEAAAEKKAKDRGRDDALFGYGFNPGHTVGTPEYVAYANGYDIGEKEARDAEVTHISDDAREVFSS